MDLWLLTGRKPIARWTGIKNQSGNALQMEDQPRPLDADDAMSLRWFAAEETELTRLPVGAMPDFVFIERIFRPEPQPGSGAMDGHAALLKHCPDSAGLADIRIDGPADECAGEPLDPITRRA